MPLVTYFQEKKKQRYMIFILIFVVLGIMIVFGYKSLSQRIPASPRVLPEKPPKIKINFEVLESEILKSLLPFEEIPLFSGELGRNNPFEPY